MTTPAGRDGPAGRARGSLHRVRVHPGALAGTLRVPGDKSISHRALILGSLAHGRVEVTGLADSGDVGSTAAALRGFGIEIDLRSTARGLSGTVQGSHREPDDVIDCGNSGTSLRLLAGLAAAVDGVTVMSGDPSLRRRPVDRIALPLSRMGASIQARGGGRLPPLIITGGRLRGIAYDSPVASAQVKSAILIAGMHAEGETIVSSPHRSRDHTERMLTYLGADIDRRVGDDGVERVHLRPSGLDAAPLEVPGDPSSAAFWLVAGALGAADGAAVQVVDVCANETRLGMVDVLRQLGADVEVSPTGQRCGEPIASITVRPGLAGRALVEGSGTVDALDELPVLAVAGACSAGGLEVRDAEELRVKESDRIDGLARRLAGIGIEVRTRPNGFEVPGGQRPTGGVVDAGGDHRMAMLACVAATVADAPVEVTGFSAVASSYPSFLDDLRALGGTVDILGGEEGRR